MARAAGSWLAVALLAALVAGCLEPSVPSVAPTSASPTTQATPTTHTGATTTGAAPPGRHAQGQADGFLIVADESVDAFRPPGNVTFTWNVTNQGADAQRAVPPSCRPERNPEIIIQDSAGQDVPWRPANQLACMVATRLVAFPSGSSFEATWAWGGRTYDGGVAGQAPAGRYTVTATFDGERGGQPGTVQVSLAVTVEA